MLDARRQWNSLPREVRSVVRWAWLVIFAAPAVLAMTWWFMRASTRDALVWNNAHWLVGAGAVSVFGAIAQLPTKSTQLLWLRKLVLAASMIGCTGLGFWYAKAGIEAHRHALVSKPERTFEYYICNRRCRSGYYLHQRQDGSTVEGVAMGSVPPYHSRCAEVQRLDGALDFTWVRVLDRSPAPDREVDWPIRAEDCFSSKPLATLKG